MRRMLVAACAIALGAGLPAAADGPATRFDATVVVDSPQGTRRLPVTIVVNRYTPRNEAQMLREALERGGQGALLTQLKVRQDGFIEMGALRRTLSLAMAEQTDGDWTYVFLTARTLHLAETERGLESLNYPFGAAVVRVDRFGRGEGELHVAAALNLGEDGRIEVIDIDGVEGRFGDFKAQR
jgi:hypothetical protein